MLKKLIVIGLIILPLISVLSLNKVGPLNVNFAWGYSQAELTQQAVELKKAEDKAQADAEQATLARQNAERDLAVANRPPADATKQAEAQTALNAAKVSEEQAAKDSATATKAYNNNPAVKSGKIEDSYDDQIDANDEKYADILEEMEGSTGDRAKIYDLQLDTNDAYSRFLEQQKIVKVCEANPENDMCKNEAVKNAKEKMDKLSKEIATAINAIAKLEQMINKEATFKVTEIFSYRKDSSGKTEALEKRSFSSVVNTLADWLITLVASLAVTALVIGGFMMIISGGDETRLETGKTIFTYSLIGLAVTLMAFGIISTIQSLFYG